MHTNWFNLLFNQVNCKMHFVNYLVKSIFCRSDGVVVVGLYDFLNVDLPVLLSILDKNHVIFDVERNA